MPPAYTAFGDKKRLFLEAVGLYLSGPVTPETIIDQAPLAREAAEQLLMGAAIGYTGTDTPAGCLLASSAISCSDSANDVKQQLASIRGGIEARLRGKIEQSIGARQLPPDADADGLAAATMAVIQGMSTLARDGATREKLLQIGALAMRIWPAALH